MYLNHNLTGIVVGFCVTLGCSSNKNASSLENIPELVAQPVILEVENHNWADVVVYLIVDGRRHRFMEVGGTKDDEKAIPVNRQGTMGQLSFAIHRIGSQDEYRTETVSIRTGRTIRLTLESNLVRSSISVF